MDIYKRIVELLVASGNVSEETVEHARKVAESFAAQPGGQAGGNYCRTWWHFFSFEAVDNIWRCFTCHRLRR